MNGYDPDEDDQGPLAGDIVAVIERRMSELEFRLAHQDFVTEI